MVVVKPKQRYRKNKIPHPLLETEGKADRVPSPSIRRPFLLNVKFIGKCFISQRVFSLLLCWVFTWCVNVLEVKCLNSLVHFPSTHQKNVSSKAVLLNYIILNHAAV